MKLIKICVLSFVVIAAFYANFSCTRDIPHVATTDSTLIKSGTVQVFDATVKSARTYVYVDGTPVSGAAVAFGGIFPGTAFAFKAAAGSRTILIKDTLSTTTQTPISFSQTIDAGKSYTVFMYDTITSAKQVTVMNNITIPTDTTCMLRFANLVYNTTALPAVDVYSYKRGSAAVFTNVATATATNFIPYASGQTDTLYIYATGTTAPLQAKLFVTSLTPSRSYTAAYAGSYKGTKSLSTFPAY